MRAKTPLCSRSLPWFVLVLTAFALGGCDGERQYSCGSCQCQTTGCSLLGGDYAYCEWVNDVKICSIDVATAAYYCQGKALGELEVKLQALNSPSIARNCKCSADQVRKIADVCPPSVASVSSPLLSQLPRPDTSYANLDGLVDFGLSSLYVEIPSDGDHFRTKLKGRVAIAGGVCRQPPCPLQVVLAELRPIQDHLFTAKGRSVSDVFLRNANTWTGRRLNDGSIVMDPNSRLAIEYTVDGEYQAKVLDIAGDFRGSLEYNAQRLTVGYVVNNKISINGQFADASVRVQPDIVIWATDCEPVVKPSATCAFPIDYGGPYGVRFDSSFSMLGNLQNSQDLCDALLAPEYEDVCSAYSGPEFPSFTCNKQPVPDPLNVNEVAKSLKFSWKDANGIIFSNQYAPYLDRMPVFPVSLTVKNKWGRTVSAILTDAPDCPVAGLQSGSGAFEFETKRGGSDYRSFDLPEADYTLCQKACEGEAQCWAWTYVEPRIQGSTARCWLKDSVPDAVSNSCCVSGVKGRKYNTDRRGSDYRGFDLPEADPTLCQAACEEEAQCMAWTYVKPKVHGSKARCWLKSDVPSDVPNSCCVSGVKDYPEIVINWVGQGGRATPKPDWWDLEQRWWKPRPCLNCPSAPDTR